MLEHAIWERLGKEDSFYIATERPSFLPDPDIPGLHGETPYPHSLSKVCLINLGFAPLNFDGILFGLSLEGQTLGGGRIVSRLGVSLGKDFSKRQDWHTHLRSPRLVLHEMGVAMTNLRSLALPAPVRTTDGFISFMAVYVKVSCGGSCL